MKELKKVYDNESGIHAHATKERYEKFDSEGVAFSVSWKSLKRYLRDSFTIDKDDKLCYDGKEVLSLEDYYLRASQMLGEIDGTLTGGNIKTLKEKMNEKYWVNSCVLIEGLFSSKSSIDVDAAGDGLGIVDPNNMPSIPPPNVEQLAGAGGGGGDRSTPTSITESATSSTSSIKEPSDALKATINEAYIQLGLLCGSVQSPNEQSDNRIDLLEEVIRRLTEADKLDSLLIGTNEAMANDDYPVKIRLDSLIGFVAHKKRAETV